MARAPLSQPPWWKSLWQSTLQLFFKANTVLLDYPLQSPRAAATHPPLPSPKGATVGGDRYEVRAPVSHQEAK